MMPLWHVDTQACGNAVILKPSEIVPSVPLRLAELFIEAGLPKGLFQVVNGDKQTVDFLLDGHDTSYFLRGINGSGRKDLCPCDGNG